MMIIQAVLIQQSPPPVFNKDLCRKILFVRPSTLTCRRDKKTRFDLLLNFLADKLAPNVDVLRPTNSCGVTNQLFYRSIIVVFENRKLPHAVLSFD